MKDRQGHKKRVLLVDPPGIGGIAIGRILGSFGTNKADQVWPPYDAQIMAGYCGKNGHDYRILDANNTRLSFDDVQARIGEYNPDWVIYMTAFPNFLTDARTASCAKAVSRDITTACMSLSVQSVKNPEQCLMELSDLDYIPWGEPEVPLMKLINGARPEAVQGIYYRHDDGTVGFTGPAPKLSNLDELGVPVHECMPPMYRSPIALRLPMSIVNCSRGCINRCVHCQAGSFQRPIRYRSLGNVLEELREVTALNIKEIAFYDCSLPSDRGFVQELCRAMCAERMDLTWHCNARADVLDDGVLARMKQAGCHTVSIGCESADDGILAAMGKGETSAQIERAVRMVKRHGMRVLMYLTFGLEGETPQTMERTYQFARRLEPDFATFGMVVPAPGTPFCERLEREGRIIDTDLDLQDPNALPAFRPTSVTPEEILSFTRKAYRRFYLRPRYMMNRLRQVRSLNQLRTLTDNGRAVLKRYLFESVRGA